MTQHDTRRDFLKKAGIAGAGVTAAAWATPSIVSMDAAAAATQNCPTVVTGGAIALVTAPAANTCLRGLTGTCQGGIPASTTYQSNTRIFLWQERANFLYSGSTYTTDSGGQIKNGDRICVWMLHFAPATTASTTLTGTLSFSGTNTIIGFDYKNQPTIQNNPPLPGTTLDQGDAIFGIPGVLYPQMATTSLPGSPPALSDVPLLYYRKTMDGEGVDSVTTPTGSSMNVTMLVTGGVAKLTTGETSYVDEVRIYTKLV